MRKPNRNSQRGSAMIECLMAGIATATLMIALFQISMGMWNYHTLAYAVHEANRYIAVHGRDCALGGNSCTITVANIVSNFESNAVGLIQSDTILTLTSASGTVHTCNPISSCASDTTQWPPSANWDNRIGYNSTVNASYSFNTPLVMLWWGSKGTRIGTIAISAQSTVQMLF